MHIFQTFIWDIQKEEILISEIRSCPALWNARDADYHKKHLKNKLFSEICSKMKLLFPNESELLSDKGENE